MSAALYLSFTVSNRTLCCWRESRAVSPSASPTAHRRNLGYGVSYCGCDAVHEMANSTVRHSIHAHRGRRARQG